VLTHLGTGSDPGLHAGRGIELGSKVLILLLKGDSIFAIVFMLERNLFYTQCLYKESEPHGSSSELPGSGQRDP
jgi:hypothetical protein